MEREHPCVEITRHLIAPGFPEHWERILATYSKVGTDYANCLAEHLCEAKKSNKIDEVLALYENFFNKFSKKDEDFKDRLNSLFEEVADELGLDGFSLD